MITVGKSAVISRHASPWVGSVNFAAPFLEGGDEGTTSHRPSVLNALVVDDDEWSRTVTARMLKDTGFQVLEAASGKEALKVVAQRPDIRLAVVDVVMPEIDGITLAMRLPDMLPDCRVILMTGHAPARLGLAGLTGRFPVLVKPFDQDQLKAKVQDALGMDF